MFGIQTVGNCVTADYYSYKKNLDWIQPTIDQAINSNTNSSVIGDVYAASQSDEDFILKSMDNSWFFSNEWQKLEDNADERYYQ